MENFAMSWGLGWKRSSDSFCLSLSYGADDLNDDPIQSPSASPFGSPTSMSSSCSSPSVVEAPESGFRIDLDWTAGDSEDQVALRLESQLMVALPAPHDTVVVELRGIGDDVEGGIENVGLEMRVEKRREPLRAVTLKAPGSGQQYDGVGVLTRLMRSDMISGHCCRELVFVVLVSLRFARELVSTPSEKTLRKVRSLNL